MIKTVQFLGKEFKIHCSENYPQHPSWYTFEDELDLRLLLWQGQDLTGGTFLDCGAAFGAWSLSALAAGAASAFAWSPQFLPGELPEAVLFENSLEENGWLQKCIVYQSALYNREGWLNLGNQQFSPKMQGIIPETYPIRTKPWTPEEGTEFLWKYCTALDCWSEMFSSRQIRWIKIDVEGAEHEVIQGASEILRHHSPTVVVEHHNYMIDGIELTIKTLMSYLGYKCIHMISKSNGDLSHGFYRKEK
jgi:FkbM family methyltransferase